MHDIIYITDKLNTERHLSVAGLPVPTHELPILSIYLCNTSVPAQSESSKFACL